MRRMITGLMTLILTICLPFTAIAQDEEAPLNDAEILTQAAEAKMDTFLTADHWAAVRNLSGVAKGVFILPSGGQAGFLVGGQWGKGLLLVRHHHDWSDPLFIKISSWQIGLLLGGQSVNGIGAVLSKDALDGVLQGKYRVGGSADFALGPGVSGKAAGGTGGIELLMVSANKGAYFGGSLEGLRLSIDETLNRQAYGDDFSVEGVLSRKTGGNYPPADNIRQKLRETAYQAVFGDE